MDNGIVECGIGHFYKEIAKNCANLCKVDPDFKPDHMVIYSLKGEVISGGEKVVNKSSINVLYGIFIIIMKYF